MIYFLTDNEISLEEIISFKLFQSILKEISTFSNILGKTICGYLWFYSIQRHWIVWFYYIHHGIYSSCSRFHAINFFKVFFSLLSCFFTSIIIINVLFQSLCWFLYDKLDLFQITFIFLFVVNILVVFCLYYIRPFQHQCGYLTS